MNKANIVSEITSVEMVDVNRFIVESQRVLNSSPCWDYLFRLGGAICFANQADAMTSLFGDDDDEVVSARSSATNLLENSFILYGKSRTREDIEVLARGGVSMKIPIDLVTRFGVQLS